MTDPFDRAVQRERLERKEHQTRHVTAWFRLHLRIFVLVNAVLALVWVVENLFDAGASWDDPWFLYSLAIWGAVLAVHWWKVRAHVRRDAALRARLDETGTP